jgi:hypothetical protein
MVVWRNYEASYDVAELEPADRSKSTYVLQEYFVPVEKFDAFLPKMRTIFRAHDVNVLNVSIRHALPDPGTLLAWARGETFAFVVYYKQGTTDEDRAEVATWTREMIDAVISVGGTYYLPYQIHATDEQFHGAYPRADEYFAVKTRVDPGSKFRNRLLDRYRPTPQNELRRTTAALNQYHREESRTYLTVPEWYIVYNPGEFADHIRDRPPSAFPYFASIGEFWRLYDAMDDITSAKYAADTSGAHLMLMVIGSSYTAELAVKGLYEKTIGRLSEWTADGRQTQEDGLVWKYNDEYVRFIHATPWYEFPFWERLKEFWAASTWDEDDRFREIERSLSFSAEYAFKSGYAWLIKKGTKAAYEPDAHTAYAVAENLRGDPRAIDSRLGTVKRLSDGRSLISMPRYEPFGEVVAKLVKNGVRLDEISGNDEIVLTVLAPSDWAYDLKLGRVIFDSRVASDPSKRRLVIETPVSELGPLLAALEQRELALEHLYDY